MSEMMTSIDLDVLAEQSLLHAQQQREQQRQREAEAQARKKQEAQSALLAHLEQEIADLLPILHPTFFLARNATPVRCVAQLHYADAIWEVVFEQDTRWGTSSCCWSWDVRYQGQVLGGCSLSAWHIAPGEMREALLTSFGRYRAYQRAQAEQQAEREQRRLAYERAQEQRRAEQERHQRAYETQLQEEQAREEQQRADAMAQCRVEDAHWRAELATRKQQAEATLWRWPTETAITLYHLTYTIGVGSNDAHEPLIEEDAGWTAVDHLDAHGYIRLEAMKPFSWHDATRAREVKLDADRHLPVWERVLVKSVEALPEDLCEAVTVSLPNVVPCVMQDEMLLTQGDETEEEGYSETIGWVPLPWIRALVEQAVSARQGVSV